MGDAFKILPNLHKKYIRGTEKGAFVQLEVVFVCNLTNAVMRSISITHNKVYVSTKVLKHLYDKRPGEEYDSVVDNLHKVIKYPDHIYKNKEGKKGTFIFMKKIKGDNYLCSLEIITIETEEKIEVVTGYRIRKDGYMDSYELLWSWRDGDPSS